VAKRTFGVCDLTLPARARDPWTLPMIAVCQLEVTDDFAFKGGLFRV
jgi:hypothetical protein